MIDTVHPGRRHGADIRLPARRDLLGRYDRLPLRLGGTGVLAGILIILVSLAIDCWRAVFQVQRDKARWLKLL
jgi:hypothetical protein